MALQGRKKRVIWLDLLRVIATCFVPMAHLCSNVINQTPGVLSSDYITLNFFNSMCRWVVPTFVMISGVFFLNKNKECDPKRLFTKNVVRMATAFIFWSFLYALQQSFFPAIGVGKEIPAFSEKAFINDFISGEYHMWYLYMIALLYLITPLIRVFTDNATKKQLEAFMVLSFVFSNLAPMLLKFPFIKQFEFDNVYDYLHLSFIGGYAGLYMGGQYMVRYPFRKKTRIFIYAMGVLGYALMAGCNLWLSVKNDKPTKAFLDADNAASVMIAYALFTFFQHVVSKVDFKEKAVKAIKWLSARSFGVYLCHVFVMRAFQYFGIQVIHFDPKIARVDLTHIPYIDLPPLIMIPLLTLLVLIGSFGVSWVVSRIPVLKKYVV